MFVLSRTGVLACDDHVDTVTEVPDCAVVNGFTTVQSIVRPLARRHPAHHPHPRHFIQHPVELAKNLVR